MFLKIPDKVFTKIKLKAVKQIAVVGKFPMIKLTVRKLKNIIKIRTRTIANKS